jgi:hypothetical protein
LLGGWRSSTLAEQLTISSPIAEPLLAEETRLVAADGCPEISPCPFDIR